VAGNTVALSCVYTKIYIVTAPAVACWQWCRLLLAGSRLVLAVCVAISGSVEHSSRDRRRPVREMSLAALLAVLSYSDHRRRALYQHWRPSVIVCRRRLERSDRHIKYEYDLEPTGAVLQRGRSGTTHTRTHVQHSFNRATPTGRRKLLPGLRVQSTGTYAVDKHNGPVNYVTADRAGPPARRKTPATKDGRRRHLRPRDAAEIWK